MAISHELSSEIATALLASRERSPRELDELKEMVLQVHATLERLIEKPHVERTETDSDAQTRAQASGSAR